MDGRIEHSIFGDVSEETFAREIWGIRPHHSKQCFHPESFFSIEELTDTLRETGLIRYGTTSVGKERRARFQPYRSAFDVGKLKSVRKLHIIESLYDAKACFDDGRSILAHRLERFLPPTHNLRKIYNHLLDITGCIREEIIIAAFLTPPFSKTFDWHVDSDHVFTMQIEGTKVWEIEGADGRIETIELSLGDILYVPSDIPHRVISTDRTSLSVSYVVIPKTYTQIITNALLKKLDAKLKDSIKHTTPLPLHWKRDCKSLQIDDNFRGIFESHGLDERDFLDAVIDEYISDSASYLDENWTPNFRYTDQKLDRSSILRKSSPSPIEIIRTNADGYLIILMNGRPHLTVTPVIGEAIEFIQHINSDFSCDDLPKCYDLETKILICEKLLQAGMLDFA